MRPLIKWGGYVLTVDNRTESYGDNRTASCDIRRESVKRSSREHSCNLCYYKDKLLNMLAVVHRDGGHYTEEYGIKKSVEDVTKIIAEAIQRLL